MLLRSRLFLAVYILATACNGLRSGPIDNATSPSLDGGSEEGGKGSSSGNANLGDGGSSDPDAASVPIDADIDPEWAMTPLPVPLPPAGNYSVADGVVKDEVTGLAWMQSALVASAHPQAETACATSTLNGGGWRLPTRTELLSIAYYTSKGFNQDVFSRELHDGVFWASTPDAVSASFRWSVRFGVAAAITDQQSAVLNVRCVRGPALVSKGNAGAPRGHYIHRSQFVAYDVRTRLEWMRQPAKTTTTGIEDALNTCASSTLEGTQWRLPSARELETLFDVRATTAPAWDIATFGTAAVSTVIFWTLTELPDLPSPYTHLGVDFRPSMSTTTLAADTSQAFVRCVRGPK